MAAIMLFPVLIVVLLAPSAACGSGVVDADAVEGLGNVALASALRDTNVAFGEFLTTHGKSYTGAEFQHRLGVFEKNLLLAVENQLNDPTAVHGVTQFFDLTTEEFAQQFLGLNAPEGFSDHPVAPLLPTDGLPDEFDWRTKGAVTPVKNQGVCGSCYAFSAVGAIEGAHYLSTGELVSLSEQQVVDCDHACDPTYFDVCDSGCMGGLMNNVFTYVLQAGGVALENDYPYTGRDGTCKFTSPTSTKVGASLKSYAVVSKDELQIAANLVKYGPLAIAINAAWMQTYVKGVSCPIICNKKALNHGVLLVGWGEAEFSAARLKKLPYWIIKNSWGANWGEAGYYHACSGRAMCGLNSMVSSAVATGFAPKDVIVDDTVQAAVQEGGSIETQ
eukprot:TRINITY_DN29665_c0_g1_i1.p1 TRINITY_DN29665_c0_g1~~TRINITY_DN29665_c0_g1_i1.p1  ORF type:complete len:389 (+),score=60.78 TRINITY_DN29665_c0_g1_i1:117-1283(+)